MIFKYIEFVILVYIIRFLTVRIINEFTFVKNFYNRRKILPGVRNWNNRIEMIFRLELFALLESIFIVVYFLIFTRYIPFNEYISFFIYSTLVIIEKVRYSTMLTNYPISLLLMDILIFILISFLQFSTCILFQDFTL